jgi:hypothetical protein
MDTFGVLKNLLENGPPGIAPKLNALAHQLRQSNPVASSFGGYVPLGGGPEYRKMDLVNQQQLQADEWARENPGKGMLYALLSGGTPGGAATVFHGSPHRFSKFDLSKVGTGEGAQAYGHGLYLAENPAVAKSYQVPVAAERRGATEGNLYQVDLPDPVIEKMLDWDKPLSQQNPHVRASLQKVTHPAVQRALQRDWTGHKLVTTLEQALSKEQQVPGSLPGVTQRVGGPQATTQLLRDAGIPGTQYLDAGSRGAGTGTRNYVAFDDALVRILGRE